jgi:Ala-tRNA(Pro) deacylase
MISTRVKEYLDSAGVAYTVHPHRRAYTSQEIAESVHIPGGEMLKSVMLETDDKRLVMAVVSASETVNLDALREQIGCRVLRLASEAEFRDAFPTCEAGAMPPLGNIFDVPVYCDVELSRNGEVDFNAGAHDETIRMKFDDFRKLANPIMLHFAQPYREGMQRLAA